MTEEEHECQFSLSFGFRSPLGRDPVPDYVLETHITHQSSEMNEFLGEVRLTGKRVRNAPAKTWFGFQSESLDDARKIAEKKHNEFYHLLENYVRSGKTSGVESIFTASKPKQQ